VGYPETTSERSCSSRKRSINSSSLSHLFLATLFLLRLLQYLLDDLLLFDQESTNDSVPDAVGASGATVGTLDGLLRSGCSGIFSRSKSWDLYSTIVRTKFPSCLARPGLLRGTYTWEFNAAITTFGSSSSLLDVQQSKLAAGGLDDTDVVRGSVVRVASAVLKSNACHCDGIERAMG